MASGNKLFGVAGSIKLGISIIPDIWFHTYGTIVHELGHYKFDLGDEYRGFIVGNAKNPNRYCRSTIRHGSVMDVPYHHLLAPRGTSEFCTPDGPNSKHKPRDLSTGQPASTDQDGLWSLGYTSCWETINNYNNSIMIPTGDPDPGPCSNSEYTISADSHEPLEAHLGTAKFVVVIGP